MFLTIHGQRTLLRTLVLREKNILFHRIRFRLPNV